MNKVYLTSIINNHIRDAPSMSRELSPEEMKKIEVLFLKWKMNSQKQYISKENAIELEKVKESLLEFLQVKEKYTKIDISIDEYRMIIHIYNGIDESRPPLLNLTHSYIFNSLEKDFES